MSELIDKQNVDDGLYIYHQANSEVWIARFKIGGKWISRTTKQRDRAKAETAAIKVRAECEIKHEHGIAIQTRAFRDVAKLAIERMQEHPDNAKGASTVKDHELALNKYHIPYFDRTYITSIDRQKLAEFDAWRIKKLGRTPAQSTLKTHNVALRKVFDEAVIRKWMTPAQIPVLSSAGGIAATRRDYFTADEIAKIRDAFPAWIAEARKGQTQQIRELLFFYFNVAVHTGLRPGTEMDNLRWRCLPASWTARSNKSADRSERVSRRSAERHDGPTDLHRHRPSSATRWQRYGCLGSGGSAESERCSGSA